MSCSAAWENKEEAERVGRSWVGSACKELAGGSVSWMEGEPAWSLKLKDATVRRGLSLSRTVMG